MDARAACFAGGFAGRVGAVRNVGGVSAGRGLSARGVCARRARPRGVVMVEPNTVAAVAASMLGVAGGVGLLVFTEQQGQRTDARANTQVCTMCLGAGEVVCDVCGGTGVNVLREDEICSHCDGKGMITCTNCGGTGVQPRFLDRLSPDDFMD